MAFPLVAARGFLFADLNKAIGSQRDEKRGWTIQHHPASNASKALPDSPGRAARKPAGNKASVSGTELLLLPKIHGGSGSEKQASSTCLPLFFEPAKQVLSKSAWEKCLCRRICLEVIVGHLD